MINKILGVLLMAVFFSCPVFSADTYTSGDMVLTKPAKSSLNWDGKVNGNFDIISSSVPTKSGSNAFTGGNTFSGKLGIGASTTSAYGIAIGTSAVISQPATFTQSGPLFNWASGGSSVSVQGIFSAGGGSGLQIIDNFFSWNGRLDLGTLYGPKLYGKGDIVSPLLGLNDSTPAYAFDVTGGGHFTSSMTVDAGIYGNLTGSVTGASSLNVLKAGDTMTGPLTLAGSSLTVTGASGVLANVLSPSSTTIRITNTTSDSTWFDGEYYGGLEFYSADSSGAGAGVKAAIRAYEYGGGTTGGPGRLGFFVTGGTNDSQAMTLTQTGGGENRLGVGTLIPSAALDITGSIRATSTMTIEGNSFSVGGSSFAVVAGRAGVGVSPTAYPFEVLGTAGATDAAAAQIGIRDDSGYAANVGGKIGFLGKINSGGTYAELGAIKGIKTNAVNGETGGGLAFLTKANGGGQSTKMVVLESGNIGMGSTAPAYKLDVSAGGANDAVIRAINTSATTASNAAQLFLANNTSTVTLKQASDSVSSCVTGGIAQSGCLTTSGATALVLGTNSLPRMAILSGGNVGVGTIAPASTMTVAGPIHITGSNPIFFGALDSTTNKYPSIRSDASQNDLFLGTYRDMFFATDTNAFGTGTTRLVIKQTTGNVGIGTIAPGAKLDIEGKGWNDGYARGVYATNASGNVLSSGAVLTYDYMSGASIAFTTAPANATYPVGTLYDTSCAAGAVCRVCTEGICPALLVTDEGCTVAADLYVIVGDQDGRAQCVTAPDAVTHNRELGQPASFNASATGPTINIWAHRN